MHWKTFVGVVSTVKFHTGSIYKFIYIFFTVSVQCPPTPTGQLPFSSSLRMAWSHGPLLCCFAKKKLMNYSCRWPACTMLGSSLFFFRFKKISPSALSLLAKLLLAGKIYLGWGAARGLYGGLPDCSLRIEIMASVTPLPLPTPTRLINSNDLLSSD